MPRVVVAEGGALLELKRSKFYAFAMPYTTFGERLRELKALHPKARHFVWAYRHLDEGELKERQSDDGEPAGTSGRPTLAVLQKQEILQSAIVIVRYFGGIKLGASGLVKAYTKAAVKALEAACIEELQSMESWEFFVEYPNLSKVHYHLDTLGLSYQRHFEERGARFLVTGTKEQRRFLQDVLHDLLL